MTDEDYQRALYDEARESLLKLASDLAGILEQLPKHLSDKQRSLIAAAERNARLASRYHGVPQEVTPR